ncbi:MAG: UvrD-helicase domain-containing protein [Tannerella sp.]|jgi:ATP-dependent exoDNAse (exonuclease V) beta subunit|nr:UvrD-helicase domain-containing protein [Tannerella sp.]
MLTIYNASAGTGKTHTLTGEYLALLFKEREQHRHILAVTFTNKATAEMKNRIISELYRLSAGKSSDYIAMLSDGGRLSEDDICRKANSILINILHDYTSFNISTIDHFFQHTVRAFTRETGLQSNYQIEMDEDAMLEDCVEEMLSSLEKPENAELLTWLINFTEEKINDGKTRDIKLDIIKLGKQLFKESFKAHGEKVKEETKQKQFLKEYRAELYKIIGSTQKQARELGEEGLAILQKHGLKPTDMAYKTSSPFRFFEKLAAANIEPPSNRFFALEDNASKYFTKEDAKDKQHIADNMYHNGMNVLIKKVISFCGDLVGYNTALVIASNFYSLGILADLWKHLTKWRDDNNKLFISDTTELLNKVIDGSEVPFIYEKTGTRIEHYMIDEFQDTSALQWANFRPLLKDSLDSGRNNLIVGDVKQSIYRFRNSDWSILSRQVESSFPSATRQRFLDVNWRSLRHIVEFNNLIFGSVPYFLQEAFNNDLAGSSLSEALQRDFNTLAVSAYAHAEQKVAPPFADKAPGHVKVKFIEQTKENPWQNQSLAELPLIIEQLQSAGYELRDIAVLTRYGAECAMVAETLLAYRNAHPDSPYRFDIITEESLTVNGSVSVRWMVAMLHALNEPEENSVAKLAQLAYALMKRKDAATDDATLFQPLDADKLAALQALSNRSLYETVESLYRLFEDDFSAHELVFIQAFIDIVSDYTSLESGDTSRFLEWWDIAGCNKNIKIPDSQNAIRIMTIHKSKGLGFKAVIIPFADWKFDRQGDILWCKPDRPPFNRLTVVPVKYTKSLADTVFAYDFFNERMYSYIDSLNILYVALTRAKEELIITAPLSKGSSVGIPSLLMKGVLTDTAFAFDTSANVYERGKSVENIPASFQHVEELPVTRYYSASPDERMRLRLRPSGGMFDDSQRKYGLLMHDILSAIVTRDDIAEAVSLKVSSGEITASEAADLNAQLMALTAREDVRHWFDGSMKVMNEAEIIFDNGQTRRPDRVMIKSNVIIVDYKFGERNDAVYSRQMAQYRSLMLAMGFVDVECYLWYVNDNPKPLQWF